MYLNRGIARLWPHIYRVSTGTITILASTHDYAFPVAAADGLLISVEMSTAVGGSEYGRFDRYDVLPGDEDAAGLFRLSTSPDGLVGYTVQYRYVQPCTPIVGITYAAMQSEVWVGPDRAIHLPVLYAMGMIASRKLDDRQDTYRYSTVQASNGVTDSGIMQASQLWMGQFELELSDMARPLPIAKD
jgi:hypothetical protein